MEAAAAAAARTTAGTEHGEKDQYEKGGESASSGAGSVGGGGDGGGGGGGDGGGSERPRLHALSPLPETDMMTLEDALGLHEEDAPSTAGSQTGGKEEGKEGSAFSCTAPTCSDGRQGSKIGEPGGSASGIPSLVGCDAEVRGTAGIDKTPSSAGAVDIREEEGGVEEEEDGSGRKTGLDGSPETHALARLGGGKSRSVFPETDPFLPVYLGLYRNLAEAKGVPSGFKSRTTKSMDEGKNNKILWWV